MSKHTPGPWHSDGPDCFGDFNIVPAHESLAVGAIVSNGFRPIDETEANARLAAAAPQLLEAAQNMLTIGIINPTGSRRVEEGIQALREAIAKATGTQDAVTAIDQALSNSCDRTAFSDLPTAASASNKGEAA